MRKLLMTVGILCLVACTTESIENTSNQKAKIKENTFNPNPTPEEYKNAKHPSFMQDLLTKNGSVTVKKQPVWIKTYVPDPAFRTALINLGAGLEDSISGDNYIFIDKSRGGLYLNGAGISDLTGIQSFTSLFQLGARGNNLTTLNVSSLTNLGWLDCSQNNLTSLDLRLNRNLRQIWCHSNELTSLKIPSTGNKLWGVWCYGNKLTTLNLRGNSFIGNTKITHLFCHNNKLTTLNLNLLNELEAINCSSNEWVTLNFNSNSKLTSLWCYSNTLLTDLSIKNNNNFSIVNQDFRFNTKSPDIHVDEDFLSSSNSLWPKKGTSTYKL